MTATPPKSLGRVILVRHGESEGNRDRRFTQNEEVPLTDTGREQARQAGERIFAAFAPEKVIASPYTRARTTGEIIASRLNVPVSLEPALREQSFGALAGQPYDALLADASFYEGPRWAWRPPDGESLVDVYERAVPAFDAIARAHVGRDVVVVSHGGVMFALGAYVAGSWEASHVPPNCGIVVVEQTEQGYRPPIVF